MTQSIKIQINKKSDIKYFIFYKHPPKSVEVSDVVKVSKLAVDCPMVVSVPELLQQVDVLVQLLHTIHRKIRFIECNAKCRHLKKLPCKGTLRLAFI